MREIDIDPSLRSFTRKRSHQGRSRVIPRIVMIMPARPQSFLPLFSPVVGLFFRFVFLPRGPVFITLLPHPPSRRMNIECTAAVAKSRSSAEFQIIFRGNLRSLARTSHAEIVVARARSLALSPPAKAGRSRSGPAGLFVSGFSSATREKKGKGCAREHDDAFFSRYETIA